jgi:hypothetical protein
MDLARPVEDFIELARAISIPFKGLLFWPSPGATKPSIDCGVLGITVAALVPALILVVPGIAIAVACLRRVDLAVMGAMSQPTILSHAKTGHEGSKGRHGPRLVLPKLSCKPLIPDTVPEGGNCLCVGAVDYLVLFS